MLVAEGLQPLAVWNLAPLVLAATTTAVLMEHDNAVLRSFSVAFVFGLVALVGAFHLAWMLDIGGTRTGSSTAALALVVVPIVAVAAGVGVGAIAALAAWLRSGRRA